MSTESDKPIHADANDGWHGIIFPNSKFAPQAGRYHLYIGLFCPFAHRANLVRHLKGLQDMIDVSVVKPYPKGEEGWRFPSPDDAYPAATKDKLFGSKFLHEVYFKADKGYKGKYSVPVLWDTKEGTIVNNESAELLRWLPTAFNDLLPEGSAARALDLYPASLRSQIDDVTVWMQRDLNSGVYTAGFATDQATYDAKVPSVFAALNRLERLLHSGGGPYVLGGQLTELDIRAYATVVRFDVTYVQHFKCNLGTIRGDYPVIHEWVKNLYWNVAGFRETTDFKHIKENYTKSHSDINPHAITPMGPFPDIQEGVNLDFSALKPGSVDHPLVLQRQKELYE